MNSSSPSILILGPAETSKYFGGVAVFCEGNAISGSRIHGCAVVLNRNVLKVFENGALISEKYIGTMSFFTLLIKYLASRPKFLLIQLEYGLLAPALPLFSLRSTKKIFYAHGFPPASYAVLRKCALLISYRLGRRYCDQFITNSHYTASILDAIWGLKSDRVVNPGVSDTFINAMDGQPYTSNRAADYHFLYVGRLTAEKGLINILRTLACLKHHGATLDVIGEGPDQVKIKSISSELGIDVRFHGRLSSLDVANQMLRFRSFVSANPHEPFGITFAEATLAGCHVYCPPSGGQIDIARRHQDGFTFVDFSEHSFAATEIESTIEGRISKAGDLNRPACKRSDFTYASCASKLFS